MPVLLSIGHGYVAQTLAPHLLNDGWTVIGTTRSPDKAERFAEAGVEPLIWPGEPLPLARATHVLSSVSPGSREDPVLSEATHAFRNAELAWIGYLSTIGVYGDREGGWVDETSAADATSDRGRARVAAEAAWQALTPSAHLFRLGGIYGPRRGPFDKVLDGTAHRIDKPGQVFNRIHVDDIVQVLRASMARPHPGAIYNVTDGHPVAPQDVVEEAARLLGVDPPPLIPFEEADLSPMARSFYADSKRVKNDRIRNELGVSLFYPDYRAGLAAILRQRRGE